MQTPYSDVNLKKLSSFGNLKIVFLSLTLTLCVNFTYAQNVGFGTSAPQYRADVAGRMRIKQSPLEYPGLRMYGSSNQQRVHIGPINDDHLGFYGYGGGGNAFTFNVINGNIGIGTISPAFKLDMVGRMRIQQDTSSAGIWFDGTTTPVRSFAGTYNNDYVGLYGSGGAGWGLVMNVNNGNMGIGTLSPTRGLDINGSVRLRSANPAKGNVLTSLDTEGNAFWSKPEAFKATGTLNGVPFIIDDQIWTKVMFNQTPNYNVGTGYQPAQSEYIVTVKGLYNFKSVVTFTEPADKHHIRIRLERNGVITTIGENYHQGWLYYRFGIPNSTEYAIFDTPSSISVHAELLPGDKVWVETNIDIAAVGGSSTTISEVNFKTWFSGKLIART